MDCEYYRDDAVCTLEHKFCYEVDDCPLDHESEIKKFKKLGKFTLSAIDAKVSAERRAEIAERALQTTMRKYIKYLVMPDFMLDNYIADALNKAAKELDAERSKTK
jgi:hypothetical protein